MPILSPDVIMWDAAVMYPSAEDQLLFMDIGDLWMQEDWEEVYPQKVSELSQAYFLDMVVKPRWNELDFFPFPVIDPNAPLGETLVCKGSLSRLVYRSGRRR